MSVRSTVNSERVRESIIKVPLREYYRLHETENEVVLFLMKKKESNGEMRTRLLLLFILRCPFIIPCHLCSLSFRGNEAKRKVMMTFSGLEKEVLRKPFLGMN
jgi:hypothetical protein